MFIIGKLLILALQIYSWIIIASVVISWLIAFEVVNAKNEQAQNLLRFLDKVTKPVYQPLRKFIPPVGGIDVTPIVVLFAIYLLQQLVVQIFMMPGYSHGMFW